jgi:ABC-2 type transport system permease protein
VTARVLSAFVFGAAAAALVAVAAVSASAASLPPRGYAELALVLVASLVTFGLFGVALGYWTTPRSALPLANLLYLVLSYAGGLWMRPARLPGAVEAISRFLPTRWIAELSLGVARGSPWRASDWLGLAVFATVFAAAAIAGYRRDEGQRFR